MRIGPGIRLVIASTIALGGAALSGVAPASAGGQGSFTETFHFNSVQQWGTPPGTPTNNTNCSDAVLNDFVLLNLTGNGVQHVNVNGAGDSWFTTTFTGSGVVTLYPFSSLNVTFDNQGNVINADIVGPPDMVISARITEWFGFEDNNQNAVGTGTVNLQGTTLDGGAIAPAGQSVSFHNLNQVHWAVGADPEGPPTFFTNKLNC